MEAMNMIDLFHFLRPLWLLCLPLWLLLSYLLWTNRQQQNGWSALCDPALLSYLVGDTTEQANRSTLWLIALMSAGCIAIVALAGPVWKQLPQPTFQAQSAMVIVLDLSRSMDAEDLKPSRLIRAKQKVQDILAARTEGQAGLVVFAGSAFDVIPLTTDNRAILSLLSSLDTSMMPAQGSMASEALKHAYDMFKRGAIRSGSVVLLCDGIDKAAIKQAKALSDAGHILSVLAVGTTDGAPIPARETANGTAGGFMKDGSGNIILARVDDDRLSALAAAGDGLFQHIRLDDSDVRQLPGLLPSKFSELNAAQNQSDLMKTDTLHSDQWHEEGPWLLLLVLPLCLLAFRRGALFIFFLAPLLSPFIMPTPSYAIEWDDLWHTQDQQAQKLMAQEKSKDAAEQFKDPQWKAMAQYRAGAFKDAAETLDEFNDTTSLYNRGNALAKAGDLQAALDTYDEVLKQDNTHQDAQFNHDLVERLLKQQQADKKKKPGEKGDKSDNEDQKQKQKEGDEKSSDQSSEESSEQSSEKQDQQSQSSESDSREQPSQDSDSSKSGEEQPEKEKAQAAKEAEEKNTAEKEDKQPPSKTAEEQPGKEEQKQPQHKQLSESDQQALEELHEQQQLLRRIPDDPGGLLRRKFKYQYQNQQGAQGQSRSHQAW